MPGHVTIRAFMLQHWDRACHTEVVTHLDFAVHYTGNCRAQHASHHFIITSSLHHHSSYIKAGLIGLYASAS
jgi:hypothetical protein